MALSGYNLSPAALFAQSQQAQQGGAPAPMSPMMPPPAPAPMPMEQQNAAALMALQGEQPPLPPDWKVKPQPNGTLAIVRIDPDGTENIVKITNVPKTGNTPQA